MKLHILAARVLFVSAYVLFGIVIFGAATIILLKTVMTARARAKIEPARVFAHYVLDPIPESVTNIKADQPMKFGGFRYTLRFNISREDLDLIVDSFPFQRVWNIEYGNGYLDWGWETLGDFSTNGEAIIVYHPDGPREPAWFKPDLWDDPEAYAFVKIGDSVNMETFKYEKKASDHEDIRVLLYNEKESQAYFVVTHLR